MTDRPQTPHYSEAELRRSKELLAKAFPRMKKNIEIEMKSSWSVTLCYALIAAGATDQMILEVMAAMDIPITQENIAVRRDVAARKGWTTKRSEVQRTSEASE